MQNSLEYIEKGIICLFSNDFKIQLLSSFSSNGASKVTSVSMRSFVNASLKILSFAECWVAFLNIATALFQSSINLVFSF